MIFDNWREDYWKKLMRMSPSAASSVTGDAGKRGTWAGRLRLSSSRSRADGTADAFLTTQFPGGNHIGRMSDVGTLIVVAIFVEVNLRFRRRIIRITVLEDLFDNKKGTVYEDEPNRLRVWSEAFKNLP
jgi:hypothetical protein